MSTGWLSLAGSDNNLTENASVDQHTIQVCVTPLAQVVVQFEVGSSEFNL